MATLDLRPAELEIYAYEGDVIPAELDFSDDGGASKIDLTGFTVRMQLRTTAYSDTVAYEISTTNGRFVLAQDANGVLSRAVFNVDGADMATALEPRTYRYDCELIDPSGVSETWLRGSFTLEAQISYV